MKVVLFCGGQGMRLRDYSETVPKPMVNIGYRPILWHVMKYYAHFGHRDFVLCLGHKADVVKRYFLEYDECESNDFVLAKGGRRVDLLNSDIDDWRITFVDTGVGSSIGGRLRAVREHVAGEEAFLANYSDGLTDLDLDELLGHFRHSGSVGTLLCVRPRQSLHLVGLDEASGRVRSIQDLGEAGLWVNGGYFAFTQEIFDVLEEGEELVQEPFQRLIGSGRLGAFRYEGFWACMDTFKDKQQLDDLYSADGAPWEVWKGAGRARGPVQAQTSATVAVPPRRRAAVAG